MSQGIERSEGCDPDPARERIRLAYDPALLQSAGERLARELARHLSEVYRSAGNVLNWGLPSDYIARASRQVNYACDVIDPTEIIPRFEQLVREILVHGQNLHDPRYLGHQVPPPIPLAGLFDTIGAVTNQVMAVYEMGPWATAVEQAMVAKLATYLGWQEGAFAGFVTHGATLANLNALLAARNVALNGCWENGVAGPATQSPASQSPASQSSSRPPVIVVHADAHYSIIRSAGILGLGTRQVVKVALDERRRMNVCDLERTLASLRSAGNPIVAVVACACSTPIGAFDCLDDIADVCKRFGVWLHVDAAHGGSALLSPRHRRLVKGLERADSLVWDAHKMLFVPALCAFLFFKQKLHSYEAFQQNAPYLFDPSAPNLAEYDLGLRTLECTKRAAAFGLWGTWSLFGPQLFADLIDVTFDLARQLYNKLKQSPDFEPLHEPECNIVAFRHLPMELASATLNEQSDFQRRLRREVIESGDFYLVAANINGADVLRVTLMNPLTTGEHLERFLNTLRSRGREILSSERVFP